MLNFIWSFMILFSIIFAAANGQIDAVALRSLDAAKDAVTMVISLTGAMCFWSGILKIAENGGLLHSLSKLLRPIIRLLFPDINPNSDAAGAIISNMSANLLGMGNAATPLGIKAMQELDNINHHSSVASNAMCRLVVINTASMQLIPTTMIAILSGAGGQNPFDIILPTLLCSFPALVFGILLCRAFEGKKNRL